MTSRNTFLHPELICLPQVSSQLTVAKNVFKHSISLAVLMCLLSYRCYWSQVTSDADANNYIIINIHLILCDSFVIVCVQFIIFKSGNSTNYILKMCPTVTNGNTKCVKQQH